MKYGFFFATFAVLSGLCEKSLFFSPGFFEGAQRGLLE